MSVTSFLSVADDDDRRGAFLPMSLAPAQDAKPLARAIANDINSLDPHDTRAVDQDILLNLYDKLVEVEFKEQPDGTSSATRSAWCPRWRKCGPSRDRGPHSSCAGT